MNRRQLLLGSAASIAAGAVARVVPVTEPPINIWDFYPTDAYNWGIDTSILRDRTEQRWLVCLDAYHGAYADACRLGSGVVRMTDQMTEHVPTQVWFDEGSDLDHAKASRAADILDKYANWTPMGS